MALATLDEINRVTLSGITNVGNSCYCNATIQLLYSIPEIRNAIIQYTCPPSVLDKTKAEIATTNYKTTINKLQGEKEQLKIDKNEFYSNTLAPYLLCKLQSIFEKLNTTTEILEKITNVNANPISDAAITEILAILAILTEQRKGKQNDPDIFIDLIVDAFKYTPSFKSILTILTPIISKKYVCIPPSIPDATDTEYEHPIYVTLGTNKQTTIKTLLDKYCAPYQGRLNRCPSIDNPNKTSKNKTIDNVTISTIIEPNEYFIINLLKGDQGNNVGRKTIVYTDLEVVIEPTLTINGIIYYLFGSIMGSSRGDAGGHYIYERINYTSAPQNNIPAIYYNDENVEKIKSYTDTGIRGMNILNRARFVVYKKGTSSVPVPAPIPVPAPAPAPAPASNQLRATVTLNGKEKGPYTAEITNYLSKGHLGGSSCSKTSTKKQKNHKYNTKKQKRQGPKSIKRKHR